MAEEQPKKSTLSEFIEANSKLITSLAAFVALTIFSLQQGSNDDSEFVAAAASLGAILLAFELLRNVPPRPRQWRLALFEPIFLLFVLGLGQFWWSHFKMLGISLFLFSVVILVGLVVFMASLYFLQKAMRFFAIHILKMDINPYPSDLGWFTLIWAFITIALYFGLWWWLSHALGHIFHLRT